jgi:hypothetical protein
VILVATKKGWTTIFFSHLLLLLLDPGSEIQDKHTGSATLALAVVMPSPTDTSSRHGGEEATGEIDCKTVGRMGGGGWGREGRKGDNIPSISGQNFPD